MQAYIKYIQLNTQIMSEFNQSGFTLAVKNEIERSFLEGYVNRMKIPAKVNYAGFLKLIK